MSAAAVAVRVSDGTRTRDRLDHNTVRLSSGIQLSRTNSLYDAISAHSFGFESSDLRGVGLRPCCHRVTPRSHPLARADCLASDNPVDSDLPEVWRRSLSKTALCIRR